MTTSLISPRRWGALAGAAVATAAIVLAGCSSSGKAGGGSPTSTADQSSSTSTGVGDSSAPAAGDIVAQAKKIVSEAQSGMVGSATPDQPLTKVAAFNGPTTGSSAPRNIKVIAVSSCVDPCQYAGSFTQKLGKSLGWTYELKQSTDGSPQSFVQLTQAAIQEKPNVILFLGVPDLTIQQQIGAARAAGIKMIGVSTTPHGAEKYDAYVTTRQDVTYRLLAYAAIAASNGKAHVLWVTPSGFPDNPPHTAMAKAIFDQCSGCKVTYKDVQIADMFSPTAIDSFVTAQLQADPSIDYVIYVDDFSQVSAAQQAAARLGRKITLMSGDGGAQGLGFVRGGVLAADPGLPVEWIGYAGYDAVRRVLAGSPAIGPDSWGGGAHLWVKSNLPSSLTSDSIANAINSLIDYRSAYQSLWSRAK